MMSMSDGDNLRDVILFTGQSGLKIEKCLERLEDYLGQDTPILKIEQEIENVSKKAFKREILSLPPRILEDLWTKAFEKTRKEKLEPKEGTYFFLTFHASYYHQGKTEFTSPVDLGRLASLSGRTKMVIALIDDCYDIYRRLIDDDEMYEYVMELDPFEAVLESIMNLFTILSWREIEIAFSRKMASFLGAPFYVVGAKHPLSVFSRLIRQSPEELRIMYLSHPISDVRKGGYPRLPYFYTELNQFVRRVLKEDDSVLFIPDAIDEKRILRDEMSGEYFPQLLNGWPIPFPSDDCLFVTHPHHIMKINPLNPRDFGFHSANRKLRAAISYLLRVLDDKITKQINSRDRTMVEQSRNGIVVYRPYWNGISPSSGVQEELKYNRELKEEYGEDKRRVILVATEEDLGKLRINRLFTEIEDSVSDLDDRIRKEMRKLSHEWVNDREKVLEFSCEKWNRGAVRASLEGVLSPEYRFEDDYVSSRESALEQGMMRKRYSIRDEGWNEVWNRISLARPYGKLLSTEDQYWIHSEKKMEEALDQLLRKCEGEESGSKI